MKINIPILFAVNYIIFSAFSYSFEVPGEQDNSKFFKNLMNAEWEFMRTRDPVTNEIPNDIKSRELEFSKWIQSHESEMNTGKNLEPNLATQGWQPRGPSNQSGRIKAVEFDVRNENIILAGSASGGLWRSLDGGLSWTKVTPNDFNKNVYCIAQDKRQGKENTWYYGSGELLSTTSRKYSTFPRTIGAGDGIFKSTDNGATWTQLPATKVSNPTRLSNIFQGVWNIVTDPDNLTADVVYAACYGAVCRSTDGGTSWTVVLGDTVNKSFSTDIKMASDGKLYAALSSWTTSGNKPEKTGIWRSADGLNWEDITPENFPINTRVIKIAPAPSNKNVFFVFTEYPMYQNNAFASYHTLWKAAYSISSGKINWEDRSGSIPSSNNSVNSYSSLGGYCFIIKVKPDDENFVIIGGTNLISSSNGFADTNKTRFLGGYANWSCHPDMHAISFLPSDPEIVNIGTDGGIVRSENYSTLSEIIWTEMNNGLTTSQFYDIAIDYHNRDDILLGGLQDNGSLMTASGDKTEPWFLAGGGDGMGCSIAKNKEFILVSYQYGNITSAEYDPIYKNVSNYLAQTPVFVTQSSYPLFYTNFELDPINNKTVYLPYGCRLWRKANMAAAVRNKNLKDSGWTEITGSYLQEGEYITSLAVSRKPSDRLYFGTVNGRIFRIDNASGNNPIMINITPPEFPKAYLACIDIDPDDADKVVAVFSNYNVKSIFYSSLGGANWENIGGNLEENPDGSGAGPSVRCFRTARFEGKTVYFAGTSTGLYSATEIRGSQTQWFREGANSFGVILVDNIESRELDGLVAIATQGYGVFSTKLDFSGAGENAISSENAYLDQNHPNPAKNSTTFSFTNPSAGNVKLSIYDILGEEIDVVANKEMLPGKYRFIYNTEKINRGSYFYRLETGKGIFTRKMLLE